MVGVLESDLARGLVALAFQPGPDGAPIARPDDTVPNTPRVFEGTDGWRPRNVGARYGATSSVAWALPATAFVIGVAGLTIAFRRWRESSRRLGTASDDDYALVAAALEREHFDDEP